MGLYLYSRPIHQFFKRSIRLWWSEWFDQWIFHFLFNLELIWFRSFILFVIERFTNRDLESLWINWKSISLHIRIYIRFSLILSFRKFGWKNSFSNAKGNVVNSICSNSFHWVSAPILFFYSRFLNFSLFSENGIWLRIAHCEFQGFSEFESYHLVSFHTKAQSN